MSPKRGRQSPSPASVVPARIWPRCALIVAAGILAYSTSLAGPFIFDDHSAVVDNAQIRDLGNVAAVLTPPAGTPLAGRPLVNLSLAINYAISGLDVTSYHVVNIALHIACALLIFGIVRRTVERVNGWSGPTPGSLGLALAVALIWTVHPLASEVVNYTTQRTESMMAVCLLLAMYASIRALDSQTAKWTAVAVLACLAGTGCKETIVVAPLLVVLYDRVFAFTSIADAVKARGRLYAGLACSWIALAALVASHGQTLSAGFATANVSPWTYLLNQTMLIPHYLRLAVWPDSLVVYYGWPRALTLGDAWPYPAIVAGLLAATGVALVRRPVLGFLCAWVVLLLAPTSSLLPIATEVGAERRMYLPLAAIITLAVVGALFAWRRFSGTAAERAPKDTNAPLWPAAATVATLVVAVLLGAMTIVRASEYRSALTLAETVLERWPNANAQYLVGTELASAGRHGEAIPHLRDAVRGYPPARFSLGSELVETGKLDEAIAELQAFVIDEPHLLATRSARILMGRAFETKQEWPHAIEQFRLILAAAPDDAQAHGLLADALAGERAFTEAIPHYREFLEVHATDANAWTALGVALVASGKPADAIAAFRNAVNAAPENGHFRQNLARSLLERGDIGGAEEQAAQATALDPEDPGGHELLGRVLADQGKIDAARLQFTRSLELDPSYEPALQGLRAIGRQLP
ncbi:MAG TPA: tetratricopeptide repeat protein [Vicinamibacterales bacterium]|nr:tetratricopeptide repeat protein [Vicinamibacterales bacterium]